MKNKLLSFFTCLSILMIGAFALVGCSQSGPVGVTTASEFLAEFETASKVTLGADITLVEKLDVTKDIEIDLNNHTLTFDVTDNDCLLQNNIYVKSTIKNGKISPTSSIEITTLNGFITNDGELTISNVEIELNNISADIEENTNAILNTGEGVLTVKDSKITMNAKAGTYKAVGVFNIGKICEIERSVVTLNSETSGSIYGIYNYIDDADEATVGRRIALIKDSTINVTSKAVNSVSGIFSESYLGGENISRVSISGNTKVNVVRDVAEGSGKKTYGFRAKGNATIVGANNATLTIVDNTDCTKLERATETAGDYTGVIED